MMGRAKIVNLTGNGSIAVNTGSNEIGTPIPMIKPIEIPGTHEVVVQRIELLEENGTNDIETYQFIWRKPAPMDILTRFNITKPK